MINISPTAASKITELLAEENKEGSGLRVFVQGGGCSGFQCGLMIEETGTDADQVFESNGVRSCTSTRQHPLSWRRRGRFRRHGDRRRLHHQEPEGRLHVRVRSVVQHELALPWWWPATCRVAGGRRPPAVARDVTGMNTTIPDIERLRPAGAKRSSKRDLILNVFLKQEGHLSADDLFDIIRREDQRISRATVYRTLQWMVDAGIARKVDFGEGRFRFEHSYRHPRPLPPDLQDLQPVIRVPELGHRSVHRGGRGRPELRGAPERGPDLQVSARAAGPDGRRRRSTAARRSCSSRATRCGSRSRPSAAASSSIRACGGPLARDARAGASSSASPRRSASTSGRSSSATRCCSPRPPARGTADVPLLQGRRQRPVR